MVNTDVPDEHRLFKMATAAIAWATEECATARDLLAVERWPMALAVAALGIEEVGKAVLCQTMLAMPLAERAAQHKDFQAAFRAHGTKDVLAFFALRVFADDTPLPGSFDDLLAEVGAAAQRTNDTKFRALYTDFGSDGGLLKPTDVGEAEARAMVEQLEGLLSRMGERHMLVEEGDGEPEQFIEFITRFHALFDPQVISQFPDDPIPAFESIRAAMRGDGPLPAWFVDLMPTALAAEMTAALSEPDAPSLG